MRKPMFAHRHLLGIEQLSAQDISEILDLSDSYAALNRQPDKHVEKLRGRTQINLFFESSTRTQASFELAGKRLGADVMNMSMQASSMRKGETLIDTALTLNAMHPDLLVVRHQNSGAVALLSERSRISEISGAESCSMPRRWRWANMGIPFSAPPPAPPPRPTTDLAPAPIRY